MGRPKSRAQRKVALIKAHLRRGDGWIEIAVGNISTTGLMAKCPTPPAPGTEVEIRRRGSVIAGRVVWATATRFGVHSAVPIDVEEFTAESGLTAKHADAGPTRSGLWHWRQSR
jgi:hypothetical protein